MSLFNKSLKINKTISKNMELKNEESNILENLINTIGNEAINYTFKEKKTNNQWKIDVVTEAHRSAEIIENHLKENGINIFEFLKNDPQASSLIANLPNNREYFFLSDLKTKEKNIKKTEDIYSLGNNYNLSNIEVDNLFNKKLIIHHSQFNDLADKIKIGFSSKLNAREEKFLNELKKHNQITEDSKEFKLIQKKFEISDLSLKNLQSNGHLFILKENEKMWRDSGMKLENINEYKINKYRAEKIKENLINIESTTLIRSSTIRKKDFIVTYSENEELLKLRGIQKNDYPVSRENGDVISILKNEQYKTNNFQRIKDRYYELKSANIGLSEQDKSNIMTVLLSKNPSKYLSEGLLKELEPLVKGVFHPKDFKDHLISDKNYFFITKLKEYERDDHFNMEDFAKKYDISSNDITELKNLEIIVENNKNDNVEDLIKKGLLYKTTQQEENFLNAIHNSELIEHSNELKSMLIKYDISEENFKKLQKNGFVKILKSNEKEWIDLGGNPNNIKEHNISEKRFNQIILNHRDQSGQFKSCISEPGTKKIRNYKINYHECDELVRLRAINKQNGPFYPEENDSKLILKSLENGIENLNFFEKNRYFELLANGRGLSHQDYSDLMSLELNNGKFDEKMSENRLNYLEMARSKLIEFDQEKYINYKSQLEKNLISNNEYFFLSYLRKHERKNLTYEEVVSIGKNNFNISLDQIKYLESENFFQFNNSNLTKEEKIRKGFISSLTKNESQFLNEINSIQCFKESYEFLKIKEELKISDKSIEKMLKNGHLEILTEKEHDLLKSNASLEEWKNSNLNSAKYFKLNKFFLNSDFKIVAIKTEDQPVKNLIVHYKEAESVLNFREKMMNSYQLNNKEDDFNILSKEFISSTKNLTRSQKERFYELKSHGLTLTKEDIPNIDELFFLKKIDNKKDSEKNNNILKTIKNDDFFHILEGNKISTIKDERINHFINSGLLSIEKDEKGYQKYKSNWNESQLFSETRIFFLDQKLNFSEKKKEQFIENLRENLNDLTFQKKYREIEHFFKDKINTNSEKLKRLKLTDYNIYINSNFNYPLSNSENKRLLDLKLCGLDPTLEENRGKYLEIPSSYRLKKAQNLAFNNYFIKRYDVNPEHIKFINSFKQVSEKDLIKIGMSKESLKKLSEGITSKYIGNKITILKKETISQDLSESITYYSIQHLGNISGRSILETQFPDLKIERQSQKRKDLIGHDLKVVSCVLLIKEELKKSGAKIIEIKNESTQYSENKKGLSNDQRSNGPSYMDSQIIIESNEDIHSESSSGKKSIIAVEYGNYSTDRMQSKIDNSIFDEAYIFANEKTIKRYQNKIITNKTIHFRTI